MHKGGLDRKSIVSNFSLILASHMTGGEMKMDIRSTMNYFLCVRTVFSVNSHVCCKNIVSMCIVIYRRNDV